MSADNEQILAHLRQQDEVLRKISAAIAGDDFGNPGLVKRTATLEGRVDAQEKKMIWWSGIAVAVAFALSALKNKIFNA